MSDHGPQSIVVSHGIAVAIGLALAKVAHVLWTFFLKNYTGQIDALKAHIAAQDQRIAVLESQLTSKADTIAKIGNDKDALNERLTRVRIKSAYALAVARANPNVRNEEFEEYYPSEVRDAADLMASSADPHGLQHWDPSKSTPPGSFSPPRPRPKLPSRPK